MVKNLHILKNFVFLYLILIYKIPLTAIAITVSLSIQDEFNYCVFYQWVNVLQNEVESYT